MSTEASTAEAIRPFRDLPRPEGTLIGGNHPEFSDNLLEAFQEAADTYGDRVRLRFFHQKALLLRHPDDIYHVLLQNQRNYVKETRGYKAMRFLMGNGLVTSEGDFWLRQRRLAQPAFHRKRIEGFADTMARVAEKRAQRWEDVPGGEVIDVADEMMEVALDIVGKTLLSTDVAGTSNRVSQALEVVLHDVLDRLNFPIFIPLFIPTPQNRKVRAAIDELDEVVNGIIAERRAEDEEQRPPDLLTMLMEASDEETGESMSDAQLRDEVMTIFLAGHETTATALTWTWYLLSQHREAEERLHEEVDRVLDGRVPTLDDLDDLEWTRMVIDESMRLYPPVPLVARVCAEDDVIDDFEVPKNAYVFIAPYLTHRHPDFWEEPERFDPERFRQRRAGRPRFAYFPFLGGPRQCIGNTFALMEARLILATLASRFKLRPVSDESVGLDVTVTLRPEGGMPMTVEPRR